MSAHLELLIFVHPRKGTQLIKKLTTVVAVAAMAVTGLLVASPAQAAGKGLIGVAMPTQSSTRWISDGNSIKAALVKLGYTVDLQYAEDDIPTQVSQLEGMLTKGAKALIIASIDGEQLTDVLAKAKSKKVPV
ncbi:MAG: Multiple sugar-binding periplasmic protein SbpA, partial [Actinomycetota bacterium]